MAENSAEQAMALDYDDSCQLEYIDNERTHAAHNSNWQPRFLSVFLVAQATTAITVARERLH